MTVILFRRNAAEIVRLAELHVIDAELSQRPGCRGLQPLDHQFVLAARLRQPFLVGEFLARIGKVGSCSPAASAPIRDCRRRNAT